jgi:hypothetical protein
LLPLRREKPPHEVLHSKRAIQYRPRLLLKTGLRRVFITTNGTAQPDKQDYKPPCEITPQGEKE